MLRSLSLFAALMLMSLPAVASDPEEKSNGKAERLRIRVLPLKTVEVNDAVQAFNALIGPEYAVQLRPEAPVQSEPPLPMTSIGRPVRPQGLNPMGNVSQFVTAPSATVCRALADPRTRSLIVRGTDKDLQLAADLVAILETPANKPLPEVKSLKAFRLQHLEANDFVGMMQALDTNITYRLVAVGRMKLLLAIGSDEQMKDLADAVKDLDIPGIMK